MKIGVIGAGSWGTALALLLADKGYEVEIWAYEKECVDAINKERENSLFLPDIPIEPKHQLRATNDLQEVCAKKELIVSVTPSHVTRAVMSQAAEFLPDSVPIVNATKGIENDSLATISEVLVEVLPIRCHPYLAYLSGPTFARELATREPSAAVVASFSERLAMQVQHIFSHDYFRTYRSNDVIGVEMGGSIKNVIAIAVGAAAGMGFGNNTRAALITRGLAEISRMAVTRGANPLTLAGLAGMGDLVLTCNGDLSRNRRVGYELGQGRSLSEILREMKMVAEGVKTANSVHDLADKLETEMPICEQVYLALYEDKTAKNAVIDLMARELKRESFGI